MKQRCIRLRSVNDSDYKVQNNLDVVTDKIIAIDNIDDFEKNMITKGIKKYLILKRKIIIIIKMEWFQKFNYKR